MERQDPASYFFKKILKSGVKTWVGLILATVLGLAFFGLRQMDLFSSRNNSRIQTAEASQEINNTLLQDNDGDGLANWEEQLYGTNPENKDTDEDGTSDGEEVKAGRNPAIKGPNDFISQPRLKAAENRNLTEDIFQQFLEGGGAQAMLQPQVLINDASVEQNISQKIDDFMQEALSAKPDLYSQPVAGITINQKTDKEEIDDYLTKIEKIFEVNSQNASDEDDMDLYLEILESEDLSRLLELVPYREIAEKTIIDLKKIPVPENLKWFHERQLQLLEATVKEIRAFENTEKDPASALAAIPERARVKMDVTKLYLGDLPDWLDKNYPR